MLDSCLREGTSLQLAQAIHRLDARLPVILLTNSGFKNEDFPRWTAGRFLNKSLGLADLRWAVAAALNEAKSPGAPPQPAAVHAPTITTKSPSFPPRPVENGSALRIVKDFSMRLFQSKSAKIVGALLLGVVLVVGLVAANGAMRPSAAADDAMPAAKEPGTGDKSTDSVDLVEGKPHTLFVPVDVRKALGICKNSVDLIAVAQRPTRMRPLVMPGSTALDPTRIFRLRARFAPSPSSAECVEIGQIAEDPRRSEKMQTVFREIHSGDRVIKGNLLAVFYSVDVGNKKNDLVDRHLSAQARRPGYETLGVQSVDRAGHYALEPRRTVIGDINAIERAVSTLRAWGIPEEDIPRLCGRKRSP